MAEDIASNLLKIELSSPCLPIFLDSPNKEWVKFGKNNNYPDFIIDLYNRSSIHGAIVKGKSDYIYGKGLTYNKDISVLDQARTEQFLEKANRYECWNEVYRKTAKYLELFNGFAWQIIWNYGGKIGEVYCMEFSKLRRSKDGKKVFYCDKWTHEDGKPVQNPEKDESFKSFDLFNPNVRTGTQILYFTVDHPTSQKNGHLYPIPEYGQATMDIETDIEITSFHYHNLKNGMFASALLSFFNGDPSEDEKKKIKKMFNYTHSGTLNTGKIIIAFNNPGATAPDLKPFTPAELDKMFDQVSKRLQENIFTAHRSHPVLFGVMTEGSLADTGGESVYKKWDQFQRAYVEPRQQIITEQIEWIAGVNGLDLELEVEQFTPVGRELPTDPNVLALFDKSDLQKYFADKYGIKVTTPAVSSEAQPVQQEGQVNEHLKNLTGKQWIQIKRVIREITKGKITKQAGMLMLKPFGLNEADMEILLMAPDSQFSKVEKFVDTTDYVLELFEKAAIDENDDLIVEEFLIDSPKAFAKHERKFFDLTNEELQKGILDAITGNPEITPEQLAKQFNIDVETVGSVLKLLIDLGLATAMDGIYTVTPDGILANDGPMVTETYIVYSYVTRPDVPDATSRPFCSKMLKLSRDGKRWTREAIDNITNDIEEDAWTYRGGFYTNPDTHKTTAFCRHVWKAIVKSRTKKA